MTPSTHHNDEPQENDLPIARIEAQNVHYVQPLREYLESYGCQVIVNTRPQAFPHYVICVGDTQFVKTFFDRHGSTGARNLAVIYEGDEDDLKDVSSQKIRLYFVDPKPMNERDVTDLFSFFFTGRAQSKVNRKELAAEKIKSVIPAQSTREQADASSERQRASDASRIEETLRQVFHGTGDANERVQRSMQGGVVRWIVAGLVLFMTPVFLYMASLGMGVGLLVASAKVMVRGDTRWTNTFLRYSRSYLQSARFVVHVVSPAFVLIGQGGIVEDQDRLLSILFDISKVEDGVLSIFTSSRNVAGGILFPQDSTMQAVGLAEVTKLAMDVSLVSQHLALVSAQLTSLRDTPRFPFSTQPFARLADRGVAELIRARDIVGYTEKLLTLYPRIGGFRRKQTFLVLLQNSMELRPTGGFVGSLLLVTFADGKMENLEVQDVYTADGQLKGHIDPPLPIREILGQEHWYLRDSNWDPNFAVSGAQAAWFYEKEMGIVPDGVIAISLPMVTKLLEVTGPVELLDFNERISAGNFFAKSLLYTETDFFPGSTQKKDFLGALTNAVLTRVTTDRSLPPGQLLRVMTDAIQARDVQFYFADSELQSLVSQWGWSGGVDIGVCEAPVRELPCIGDGAGLVEANLGVNKTNFFVSREALSQITIDPDGSIEHAFTMKIKNDAPVKPDGSGTYQAYVRLLVPAGAQVGEVSVDGAIAPMRDVSNIVPPPAPYWFLESGGPYSVIHVPVSVPPRQVRQLAVSWTQRNKLVFEKSVMYQYTLRKQPGVSEVPWNTVIRYPGAWGIAGEGALANGAGVEYNTTLTKDAKLRVVFQKSL